MSRRTVSATTTRATSDLIVMLAEDGLTWSQIHSAILFEGAE